MPIFRYPGGKSRLMGKIAKQLEKLPMDVFHDVFVGGGSVLTYVAENFPKTTLFANDFDPNISAFWKLVANGTDAQAAELIELMQRVPTIDMFNSLRKDRAAYLEKDKETESATFVERAYHAVFFNRTTFSGISTAGAIGGVNQKSEWTVDCRYNAKTLVRDFQMLRERLQGRLTVTRFDCNEYLARLGGACANQTCYLDPPYYVQGKALYATFMEHEQHVALAETLKHRTNWVLSYDNCPVINDLYAWANKEYLDARYSVNGVKTDWAEAKECLFYGKKDMAPEPEAELPQQEALPLLLD